MGTSLSIFTLFHSFEGVNQESSTFLSGGKSFSTIGTVSGFSLDLKKVVSHF